MTKQPTQSRAHQGRLARHEKPVPMLDDPEIGHTTAIVLKTIDDLGSEAYGQNVLETLSQFTGVWLDQSQIYASIRKLLNREPSLIELIEERDSPGRGPVYKIYRLTSAGRKVLKEVTQHHREVAAYLGDV